jgi:hypothetical protein
MPEFSKEFFATLVKSIDPAKLPSDGFTPESLITTLTPILFDPSVDAKRVNLDSNVDLVKNSANNFYEGLTQKEVEDFDYMSNILSNFEEEYKELDEDVAIKLICDYQIFFLNRSGYKYT